MLHTLQKKTNLYIFISIFVFPMNTSLNPDTQDANVKLSLKTEQNNASLRLKQHKYVNEVWKRTILFFANIFYYELSSFKFTFQVNVS